MERWMRGFVLLTASCLAGWLATASLATRANAADVVLRASHQFPGGEGDLRDEMVQLLAREVAAANVGLRIEVYPAQQLVKAGEQWDALVAGTLDIAAFPLDYASREHPAFSATLMPGLVHDHDRAERLNHSGFMDDIKAMVDEAGVLVLADAWLSGGFASRKACITNPDSIKGQVARAAGPAFEEMLAAAGATISTMDSTQIHDAMAAGTLDAVNTSSSSFVSFKLYDKAVCLTAPGDNALWFMYEPILMSKAAWEKLTPEQQSALASASAKAEEFFLAEAPALDEKMVAAYRDAGVEVVEMSQDDYDAWLALAKATAWKTFAETVEGGAALLEKAQAVE